MGVFAVGQKAVHSQEPAAHFPAPYLVHIPKFKPFHRAGKIQEDASLPSDTVERKLSAL